MFRFLQKESKSILGAATLVGVLSFASRFVGFIRDRILAGAFGAGDTLDIYYAAFKIPDLLFSLIVIGAISASFIPLFLRHYHGEHRAKGAWEFTNNAVHLVGGAMILLSVGLAVFAQPLAELVAPGFTEVKQFRVAEFMRVMLIAQVILTVSMVYGSALQSLKKFFLYSLAPIAYNVGIIAGALWGVRWVGTIGLAWGVVFGAMLHAMIQWIGVRQSGYTYRWVFNWKSPDAKQMMKLMGPRTIGLAVNQLMFLLLSVLASTLAAGSVTVFQFAYNIEFFPVGIIGVSFAIAAFPAMSEFAQKEDREELVRIIVKTARQMIYLLIPMTLLFLILRAQIVRVVVGAGAFDWASTIATADTLAFFALTFIPQSLVFLLARAFYALQDTVTPLVVAVLSAFTGILTAFLLTDELGVIALAIAYSVASIVNTGVLWLALHQKLNGLQEGGFIRFLFKITAAAMVSGCIMQMLKPVTVQMFPLETFVGVFLQAAIAGGIGLLGYVVMAHVLKVDEQSQFVRGVVKSKIRSSRPPEVLPET